MARKRKQLDQHGQAGELLSLLKKEPAGWRRERLHALKLGLENKLSTEDIAQAVGRGVATIYTWFNTYRRGGIGELLSKESGKGFAGALDDKQMKEFGDELAKGKWRTGAQAYAWLQEKYGVTFHPNNIYKYLKKLGGRLKVPRPSHKKKNLEAVAGFKESLTQQLIDLNLDPKRPMRLWVYDEMRYGLAPITRKMWTVRGQEIIAPVHHRYDWGYVYGALQVGGGGCEFLLTPGVNKQWDAGFLKQISDRDPYANHVVIGDGAGFHHKQGQDHEGRLPDNIRVLTLPPYSPELNPPEKLWDIVKDGICNVVYEDLAHIEEAITEELRKFWEQPKRVISLIGEGYLLSKLNATCKFFNTPV